MGLDLPSRIFVSPHPDDIAYSCYGSLVNPPAPRRDAILVLTVFNVSDRAKGELGRRGCQHEISRVRQAEDEKFARSEGCRLLSLGFPDSSVRRESNKGPECSRDDSSKHSIFMSVKAAIAQAIGPAIGHASIYVPLGVGDHIDHRMVRDAVRMIAIESQIPGALAGVRYFEDLPYSAFIEEHEIRRLAKRIISPTPTSYVVRLENFWPRKKRAVQIYASQLAPVVMKAFADHSSAVSSGECPGAERLWISDTMGEAPVVDIMAWVTWDATKRVGDYGTLFTHMFASPTFQTSVGRTVLMGPMYPATSCAESDPFVDIQDIASDLGCSILYPPMLSNGSSLGKRVHSALSSLEVSHGVNVFYLRDQDCDHRVDRILFDLSAVLDRQSAYMQTLPGLLRDMKQQMNISVDFDIRRRPEMPGCGCNGGRWNGSDSRARFGGNPRRTPRMGSNPSYDSLRDSDSLHGLLLAQPVSDCLRGLMQPDETAVLVATDNLSLPAAFAAQMQRAMYAPTKGPTIRTLFYSGDLSPIRHLTAGVVTPECPTLDSVGGFDWEGPIRTLINQSLDSAMVDENQMPVLHRYLLDFEPLREMSGHSDLRILQQAWRLDAVAAASANVRDELIFSNRAFASRGTIPIISPGASIVSCDLEHKEWSRRKLLSYARLVWGFEELQPDNTIVATQIASAVNPAGFLRAFNALRAFATELSCRGHRDATILLIIVTEWDTYQTDTEEYRRVGELLQTLGRPSFATKGIRVKVINQSKWPAVPETGYRPTGMDQAGLHRASDISLCLNPYDTLTTAPLDALSCGSVAVMSTGCGMHRSVLELADWNQNVVIVDYAEEWASKVAKTSLGEVDQISEAVFNVSLEEKQNLERRAHQRLAAALFNTLPWAAAQRAEKIANGRRLAQQLNRDDLFVSPFVSLLRDVLDSK